MRRSPLATLLLAAAVATALPLAHASNDGRLCDGAGGLLFCGSMMVVAGVVSLVPLPPAERIPHAVQQGDIGEFKLWIRMPGVMKPADAFKLAVSYYFSDSYHGQAGRQQIIEYLLDGMVEVSGTNMTPVMQTILEKSYAHPEQSLALAKLMFAHGASASGVDFDKARRAVPDELMALLLEHGATR